MDYVSHTPWKKIAPPPARLATASVFKFSAPEGWPCLFLDLRDPDIIAAEDAAAAAAAAAAVAAEISATSGPDADDAYGGQEDLADLDAEDEAAARYEALLNAPIEVMITITYYIALLFTYT